VFAKTPQPRESPALDRSAAHNLFFNARSPLRSRSPNFPPAPLRRSVFRSAHITAYQNASNTRMTILTDRLNRHDVTF